MCSGSYHAGEKYSTLTVEIVIVIVKIEKEFENKWAVGEKLHWKMLEMEVNSSTKGRKPERKKEWLSTSEEGEKADAQNYKVKLSQVSL